MASEFEKSFSDLAYAFLQQSGVDVSKYLIGFEIVDKNDKETKGVGMFALKIGESYYYVPVFLNGGEMKPLTMMYDKKNDAFFNFNDDWISFLEKSTMPVLGEAAEEMTSQQDLMNIRNFMRPPFINKLSSDLGTEELPRLLKEGSVGLKNAFLELMKGNKQLTRHVVSTYGMGHIKEACTFNVQSRPIVPEVELVTAMDKAAALSADDKLSFMKKGYVITDRRTTDQIVPNKDFGFAGKAKSPDETGVYWLVTGNGKTRCLVITSPQDLQMDRKSTEAVVVDLDNKKFCRVKPHELTVYQEDNKSPYEEIKNLNGLTDVDKMSINTTYVLIKPDCEHTDKNGRGSEPFTIGQKATGADGNVYYVAHQNHVDPVNLIVKDSGEMSRFGLDCIIPKSYKALKLDSDDLRVFGRPELLEKFDDEYACCKMASDSLFVDGQFAKRFDNNAEAEYALVKDLNLDKFAAEEAVETGASFWMKRAAVSSTPIGAQSGIGRAIFADTAPGGIQEPEYLMYEGQKRNIDKHPLADRNIEHEIQKAVSLSEMGMKDVFDKAMVGTMTKLTDVDSELQSYIPGLMKGLDKLARMLFIFWHQGEKIREKFTLNEFKETEDLIKDTFANMGEIALDLKKKYKRIEAA